MESHFSVKVCTPLRTLAGTAVQLRRVTLMLNTTWGYHYSKGEGVAKDAGQAVSVVSPCS